MAQQHDDAQQQTAEHERDALDAAFPPASHAEHPRDARRHAKRQRKLEALARSTLLASFETQSGRAATLTANLWQDSSGSDPYAATGSPSSSDSLAVLDAMDDAVERYEIEYSSAIADAQVMFQTTSGTQGVGVQGVEPDYALIGTSPSPRAASWSRATGRGWPRPWW